MGDQQTRPRKQVLLFITCILSFSLAFQGCSGFGHRKHYSADSKDAPAIVQQEKNVAVARQHLTNGDFRAVQEKSEDLLVSDSRAFTDRALYLLGLLYAHPANPDINPQKSLEYFKIIQLECPESDLRLEAGIWTLVLQESLKQKDELKRLTHTHSSENKKMNLEVGTLRSTLAKKNSQIKKLEQVITELSAEVGKLQTQIIQLKEIDIGIQQKKRLTEAE